MDQYALDSAKNVLFDVSTIVVRVLFRNEGADISKIKMEMFADKKYSKEIVSVWLVETIKQLKQSYDVLKLSTAKIDQLMDNVISLQKEKIQKCHIVWRRRRWQC